MPASRLPNIFVSSTCYDLAQIRHDMKDFVDSIGYTPFLSEHSSFPVNTNLSPIDNCIDVVKDSADIFVLIVGSRYGSTTPAGKSITNLEYLAAKQKGIPLYVFVQQKVLYALPLWQNNREADFTGYVDSPLLFEFVESLKSPAWIFSFDTAQDIITILRKQLAYLFMEALELRDKISGTKFPDNVSSLSGKTLQLILEKPLAWEYQLFLQIVIDGRNSLNELRLDALNGITLDRSITISEAVEIKNWVQGRMNDLSLYTTTIVRIFNDLFPRAIGEPGEPGHEGEIIYVGKKITEFLKATLSLIRDAQHVHVDEVFHRLISQMEKVGLRYLSEFEVFFNEVETKLPAAIQEFEATQEPVTVDLVFSPQVPELKDLLAEFQAVKSYL